MQLLAFDSADGRADIEARMEKVELTLSYSEPYNLSTRWPPWPRCGRWASLREGR